MPATSHRTAFVIQLLIVCLLLTAASGCRGVRFVIDAVPASDALVETPVMEDEGLGWFADKVAMVEMTGLIIDASKPGLITEKENPVSVFAEAMHKASEDKRVKAVVLRINSPGGAVTASDVLYEEVRYFKQRTGKPVVVVMADVAASGGYYLACAGDHIIAHPTTITGSIGVIMQTINVSDGLSRIGIHAEAFTSGENKDMGSPLEPMDDQQRELFQNIVQDMYQNFLTVVTENRPGLTENALDEITDGRIVTGRRAHELGLVDSLGDIHDAYEMAKQMAGIERAKLVKYHRPLEYVGSAYAATPLDQPPQINLFQLNLDTPLVSPAGFYYLWDPTAW